MTRFGFLGLATGLLVIGSAQTAQSQTTVTRSQDAIPGKAVRILIAPNLKKDCSSGPMPEIRISKAPQNGAIITKTGKIKTPASYRCPGREAEVQAVFYQSKTGFRGSDQVLVEVKTAEGTVERQDIRITVDASKTDDTKENKPTATDL